MDFIQNGVAHGSVADLIINNNFTTGMLRPFVGNDNRTYVTNAKGGADCIALNAGASLRKDEWIELDTAVIAASRSQMGFVNDINAAGLSRTIANALGKTKLETQKSSNRGVAKVSMDGIARGDDDRQEFELDSMPLPLIHEDFFFTAREIAASRNGGTGLDLTGAENAATNVAETIERLALGVHPTYSFGGGTVYGLANFPDSVTTTITAPTASGWVGKTLVQDLTRMKELLRLIQQYGNFNVYLTPDWDQYLDLDYSDDKGTNTLRERCLKINGIDKLMSLDFLTGTFKVFLVQKKAKTVRMINGIPITTVKWESEGGMKINYKVLSMQLPQFRSDIDGKTGVCVGAPA